MPTYHIVIAIEITIKWTHSLANTVFVVSSKLIRKVKDLIPTQRKKKLLLRKSKRKDEDSFASLSHCTFLALLRSIIEYFLSAELNAKEAAASAAAVSAETSEPGWV